MSMPAFTRSLSARLLVLTVLFVMVAEVLIYTPSIARFRLDWLDQKLASGHLAALALVATPQGVVTEELERELLNHVDAYMVDLRRPASDSYIYMLGSTMPEIDHEVDLRERNFMLLVMDAFASLFQTGNRVLKVSGYSPRDPDAFVDVILDEAPLTAAMVAYSNRILALSIVISLFTAGLVFLSLRWLMVRPLARLTEKMVAFRDDPADADNVIVPTRRSDEFGVAQRELHDMQIAVRNAITQRSRLAALGTAVTKINHDLRNILSTAALLSERLTQVEDPKVKQTGPRLLSAIDRAADLCQHTLDYTREGGPPLHRSSFDLHELVDEVETDMAPVENGGSRWINQVPDAFTVKADRDQLRRVLVNLGRNAFEAGADCVTITAENGAQGIAISLCDDGPGMPMRAREHLFKPFAGTARPGGTGLGLAIAREIVVAHRGDLKLVESNDTGTVFEIDLPAA